MMRRIRFEFNALLEVDQIKLDLVRAVHQGRIRDEPVQKRRFAGARLAGHEQMLRRALAQPHRLQPPRAGPTDRHDQFLARVPRPVIALRRRDLLERHLDLHRILGCPARRANHVVESLGRRRSIERERQVLKRRIPPAEPACFSSAWLGSSRRRTARGQCHRASPVLAAARLRPPNPSARRPLPNPSDRSSPASFACDRP